MGWGAGMTNAVMKLGFTLSENEQKAIFVDSITLFFALLCACIIIGHLFEEIRWINESITALIIGLGTGGAILLISGGKSSRILEFDEQLFFIYLLPPIIFNAGFQVKKKHFFQNVMTIMLFGGFGTLLSFAVISFGAKEFFERMNIGFLDIQDYLALGAIFSATDSVCTLQVLSQDETPFLYSVVFGEGVVNDATSVVLFNAIQKFDLSQLNLKIAWQFVGHFLTLFITSTLLGIIVGLLSAYIIKKLYIGRHSTNREVSLMMLMAYLSYVMAELFDLSGILTVFFCGIVMSHYTWHNITAKSKTTTKHTFATLSFIAETFIFLYVGMDALDIEKWKFVSDSPGKSVGISAVLLSLVLLGRAAFVFPLSFLSNCIHKSKNAKINYKQQVTIWWAGLMRGAVSIALAYNKFTRCRHTQQPGNAMMITSTITVVLCSTVVFGLLTKPLVRWLFPSSRHHSHYDSSGPFSPEHSFTLPLLADEENSEGGLNGDTIRRPTSLRMLLETPGNTLHYYWRKFDDTLMRPVFGGKGFGRDIPDSSSSSAGEMSQLW